MAVPKELLEVLACPKCKGDVKCEEDSILCDKCKLKFKVLGGNIPDMLLQDAEKF